MQNENSISQQLKYQWRTGNMTMKLIFVNIFVFLLIKTLEIIGALIGTSVNNAMGLFIVNFFTLNPNFNEFIWMPWGVITSIFSHFGFLHLLFNMVFLYFSGKYFESIFDSKRLIYTYILAGIGGNLLEILAHAIFPGLPHGVPVIGASGAIMGVFTALAFHRPNAIISLFGLLQVRIIFVALFYLLIDYISLGQNDGTAHFAHIGGAIIGYLSIKNLYGRGNIVTAFQRFGDSLIRLLSKLFGFKKNRLKVIHRATGKTYKSDAEYNVDAKTRQLQLDKILDKISKSGYNSLTKEERDFLFKESNK